MAGFVKLHIIVWFALCGNAHDTHQHVTDENNYRAALYSTVLDFSKSQHIVPEMKYRNPDLLAITYKYFIQYGNDIFIEILDPSNELKSFTGCIKILDYTKKESTFTCIIDHARSYHTTKDSITYSIEESQGSVTDLCEGAELNPRCDSVRFISHSTKTDFTVIFNDTIANLRAKSLFYPDIEYLPYKIMGVGQFNNNLTLEQVIYGKSSIDSLLQLYNYEGYEQITDEEIPLAHRQFVIELIEKLKSIKE